MHTKVCTWSRVAISQEIPSTLPLVQGRAKHVRKAVLTAAKAWLRCVRSWVGRANVPNTLSDDINGWDHPGLAAKPSRRGLDRPASPRTARRRLLRSLRGLEPIGPRRPRP